MKKIKIVSIIIFILLITILFYSNWSYIQEKLSIGKTTDEQIKNNKENHETVDKQKNINEQKNKEKSTLDKKNKEINEKSLIEEKAQKQIYNEKYNIPFIKEEKIKEEEKEKEKERERKEQKVKKKKELSTKEIKELLNITLSGIVGSKDKKIVIFEDKDEKQLVINPVNSFNIDGYDLKIVEVKDKMVSIFFKKYNKTLTYIVNEK